MPTIVIRHPDGSTEEREVKGRLTIGADEENDLVLRSAGVSQRHAQFFADGGELVLENVGSAAATIVDGETLNAPRRMKPGVRVLIGEYEVSLKPDRVSVRKLAPVAPSKTLSDDEGAKPPPRKGLFLPLLVAGALVLGAAVAWLTSLMPAAKVVEEIPLPPPAQPCAELQPQVLLAREEPSERSLAAANKVLECDPLNPEMLALQRNIVKELKGAEAAERGLKLIELDRDDEGLDALKEIPAGTKAWVAVRQQALEAAGRQLKVTGRACLLYAKEGKWVQAQPACERAMALACQGPAPVPELSKALARAREVNDPKAPKWTCPALPLLKPPEPVEDPVKAARAAIAKKYPDAPIAAAVNLYMEGKLAEAVTGLQVVKEKSSKAAMHAEAERLRKDIANVDSLKKIGDGQLKQGQLEKAAKTYREALDLDAGLIPGFERTPSVMRHAIQTELADAALKVGTPLAQRPDPPRACAAFRLGMSFFRGNTALNAAASDCSTQAKALLDGARGCADLDRALALAIPGDGLADEIAGQKSQSNCR